MAPSHLAIVGFASTPDFTTRRRLFGLGSERRPRSLRNQRSLSPESSTLAEDLRSQEQPLQGRVKRAFADLRGRSVCSARRRREGSRCRGGLPFCRRGTSWFCRQTCAT